MYTVHQYILFINILVLSIFTYHKGMAQEKTKIACVGNSITEGSGLEKSYPQRLQDKLGPDYEVRNYGVSGRTLLKNGDFPYWQEPAYEAVLAWKPDVVIIKFGTNDAKPQNWLYKASFATDYMSLINAFKSVEAKTAIYLCYPLPVFQDAAGINEYTVKNEVIPAIGKVATQANLPTIDLYTAFLNKATFTYDGVHPNDKGAELMAEVIYQAVNQTAALHNKTEASK